MKVISNFNKKNVGLLDVNTSTPIDYTLFKDTGNKYYGYDFSNVTLFYNGELDLSGTDTNNHLTDTYYIKIEPRNVFYVEIATVDLSDLAITSLGMDFFSSSGTKIYNTNVSQSNVAVNTTQLPPELLSNIGNASSATATNGLVNVYSGGAYYIGYYAPIGIIKVDFTLTISDKTKKVYMSVYGFNGPNPSSDYDYLAIKGALPENVTVE